MVVGAVVGGGVFHPKAFEIVPVTDPIREDARDATPGVGGE